MTGFGRALDSPKAELCGPAAAGFPNGPGSKAEEEDRKLGLTNGPARLVPLTLGSERPLKDAGPGSKRKLGSGKG